MCHQSQKEDPSNSNIPKLNSALVIMCEYLIVQSGSNTETMLEIHKQAMDLSSFLLSNSLAFYDLVFLQLRSTDEQDTRRRNP